MKNGYKTAWFYFLIHLFVEITCFQILNSFFKNIPLSWLMALSFDFLAFVPQGLFGVLMDKYPKLNLGFLGAMLMFLSTLIFLFNWTHLHVIGLILVALGNAIIHTSGAIATTTVSQGQLSHTAIFVGGGSFGVIIGQTLGDYQVSMVVSSLLCIAIGVLIQMTNNVWVKEKRIIPKFNLANNNVPFWTVILVAFLVVIVRSYIGYAIPISWKKELWQAFLLFFTMGIGKIAGGVLSDKFGARKIGVLSTLLCVPFLLIGNNNMLISIIGVFLFSLTMSISFGTLLSVIDNSPGLAFGVTTIGLFIGVMPIFFFKISPMVNMILIIILSISCALGMYFTMSDNHTDKSIY